MSGWACRSGGRRGCGRLYLRRSWGNTLNVVAGLLLPATVIGLGRPSGQAVLVTAWYVTLTLGVLALAYSGRGLGRGAGSLVIVAYAAFTVSVLASGYALSAGPELETVLAALTAIALAAGLVPRRQGSHIAARHALLLSGADRAGRPSGDALGPGGNGSRPTSGSSPAPGRSESLRRESLLPGWTVARLWALSLALPAVGAGVDAALGRVVLMCCSSSARAPRCSPAAGCPPRSPGCGQRASPYPSAWPTASGAQRHTWPSSPPSSPSRWPPP